MVTEDQLEQQRLGWFREGGWQGRSKDLTSSLSTSLHADAHRSVANH